MIVIGAATPTLFPLLGLILGCGTWSPNAPRLTQRSVSGEVSGVWGKTPEFGGLVELRCIFYTRQRPHYANLAGYWVCTVTTNTGVTILTAEKFN